MEPNELNERMELYAKEIRENVATYARCAAKFKDSAGEGYTESQRAYQKVADLTASATDVDDLRRQLRALEDGAEERTRTRLAFGTALEILERHLSN